MMLMFSTTTMLSGHHARNFAGFALVAAQDYDDLVVFSEFHYSTSGASEIIFM
jgi:hypothetical protein